MKKADVKRLQKQWHKENAPFGKDLGYPECCIKEFCDQPPAVLERSKPSKDDMRRYKAGCIDDNFSGFIPCKAHAKQIIAGKITLESLIKDRDTSFSPFPFYA